MQTPATAEIEKWLQIQLRFFPNFDSGSGSERKTQNSGGVETGTPDPVSSEISDLLLFTGLPGWPFWHQIP